MIADATKLDMIPSGHFKAVQANHIPGDPAIAKGMIAEGFRVLKPGGTGTFSSSSLRNVKELMEQAGFANIKQAGLAKPTSYQGRLTQPAIQWTGVKSR